MNNAALAGVIMDDPIILVFDEYPGAVSRRRDCRLAFPSADDLNAQVIDCQCCNSFADFFDLFAYNEKQAS